MKYHVTPQWNNQDLQTAATLLGEETAIEMFMAKWQTEDVSFAIDQVNKIFLYETLKEAEDHQSEYGGEILVINDEWLEIFEDWTEGRGFLATRSSINKSFIERM